MNSGQHNADWHDQKLWEDTAARLRQDIQQRNILVSAIQKDRQRVLEKLKGAEKEKTDAIHRLHEAEVKITALQNEYKSKLDKQSKIFKDLIKSSGKLATDLFNMRKNNKRLKTSVVQLTKELKTRRYMSEQIDVKLGIVDARTVRLKRLKSCLTHLTRGYKSKALWRWRMQVLERREKQRQQDVRVIVNQACNRIELLENKLKHQAAAKIDGFDGSLPVFPNLTHQRGPVREEMKHVRNMRRSSARQINRLKILSSMVSNSTSKTRAFHAWRTQTLQSKSMQAAAFNPVSKFVEIRTKRIVLMKWRNAFVLAKDRKKALATVGSIAETFRVRQAMKIWKEDIYAKGRFKSKRQRFAEHIFIFHQKSVARRILMAWRLYKIYRKRSLKLQRFMQKRFEAQAKLIRSHPLPPFRPIPPSQHQNDLKHSHPSNLFPENDEKRPAEQSEEPPYANLQPRFQRNLGDSSIQAGRRSVSESESRKGEARTPEAGGVGIQSQGSQKKDSDSDRSAIAGTPRQTPRQNPVNRNMRRLIDISPIVSETKAVNEGSNGFSPQDFKQTKAVALQRLIPIETEGVIRRYSSSRGSTHDVHRIGSMASLTPALGSMDLSHANVHIDDVDVDTVSSRISSLGNRSFCAGKDTRPIGMLQTPSQSIDASGSSPPPA